MFMGVIKRASRSDANRLTGTAVMARPLYAPFLGRFMQPDPLGYEAGMNLYNYVKSDPVNLVDPLGLREVCWNQDASYGTPDGGWVVVARRVCHDVPDWAVDRPGPPIEWGGGVPAPTERISPDQKRACGRVPSAPPGVSIDNILFYGRSSQALNAINRWAFVYKNFRNGAGMDFKQINSDPPKPSPFEDFGNFAYGAFTFAIGINRYAALGGAGYAHLRGGNRSGPATSYFDDPKDQEQIKNGRLFAACMLR